jgi:hypothetical protein
MQGAMNEMNCAAWANDTVQYAALLHPTSLVDHYLRLLAG